MQYPTSPPCEWFVYLDDNECRQITDIHIVYDCSYEDGLPHDLTRFVNLQRLTVDSSRLWKLHVDRLPRSLTMLRMDCCTNTNFMELKRLNSYCPLLMKIVLNGEQVSGRKKTILDRLEHLTTVCLTFCVNNTEYDFSHLLQNYVVSNVEIITNLRYNWTHNKIFTVSLIE
jgi:hypothetical protein